MRALMALIGSSATGAEPTTRPSDSPGFRTVMQCRVPRMPDDPVGMKSGRYSSPWASRLARRSHGLTVRSTTLPARLGGAGRWCGVQCPGCGAGDSAVSPGLAGGISSGGVAVVAATSCSPLPDGGAGSVTGVRGRDGLASLPSAACGAAKGTGRGRACKALATALATEIGPCSLGGRNSNGSAGMSKTEPDLGRAGGAAGLAGAGDSAGFTATGAGVVSDMAGVDP